MADDSSEAVRSAAAGRAADPDTEALGIALADIRLRSRDEAYRQTAEAAGLVEDLTVVTKALLAKFEEGRDLARLQTIVVCLGCLRNFCTTGPTAELILTEDSIAQLRSLLSLLPSRDTTADCGPCRRACLQLLANGCRAAAAVQALCWESLFPARLLELMGRDDDATFALASAVVYNCIRDSEARCQSLAGTDGGLVVAEMVSRLCSADGDREGYEWAGLVVEALAAQGQASAVYTTLSALPDRFADISSGWLLVLAGHTHSLVPSDAHLLASAYSNAAKTAHDTAGFWDGSALGLRRAMAAWLQLWCALTSAKDGDREWVQGTGLVERTVALLQAAGVHWPLAKPRYGQQHTPDSEYQAHLRADLVRLLGNLAYRSAPLQNEIRRHGGMVAILNCCQMDERNPVVKEWYAFINAVLKEGDGREAD